MAMDYIEFLDSAKSLPQQGEINLRNAMSRAYYAAFHACDSKYQTSSMEEGGMHERLIQTLKNCPDSKDKAIGYILAQLKGLRVIADYKLSVDIKDSDRETSILQAEQLMQKIDVNFNAPSLAKKQN